MNERITTYIAEIFGVMSQDSVALTKVVEDFEKKYNTTVENILYFEDTDDRAQESFKSLALFCPTFWAAISLQPNILNATSVGEYPNAAQYCQSDKQLSFGDTCCFPNIQGSPHWAMDVIRMHVIPNFKK